MYKVYDDYDDMMKEECGVFGVYNKGSLNCSQLTYYGLYALQHRGQEGCGIVANDMRKSKTVRFHKGVGLVSEQFTNEILSKLVGDIVIGHVRYSTTGSSCKGNIQPIVMNYIKGTLSVAHNGNIINADSLRKSVEKDGAVFQSTMDTEVIAYLIAKERTKVDKIESAIERTMGILKGSYSLLVMSPGKLVAVRDPLGIRPLCMGKIGESIVFASESCALDAVGAEFIRDIIPGEIVTVDENGVYSNGVKEQKAKICLFEYIYFARPDSVIDGKSVYEARLEMGRRLAKLYPVEADLVTGVPDSGIAAAIGYSEYSKIPYGEGLIKNRYSGRTFIKPNQSDREDSVKIKLNAIKAMVKGKRIILIDDSIVRGTTIARIVKILREAGAKEIHMRVSSPPVMYPCYYGIDTPSADKLIAARCSIEEIRKYAGVDSLGYLTLKEALSAATGSNSDFCSACFDGKYLIDHKIKENIKYQFEGEGKIEQV